MQVLARSCLLVLVFALVCPSAGGQRAVYTFFGGSGGDEFGSSVSGAGDVNGDGVDDLIVGARRDNNNNFGHSGSARVFSGVDGSVLYTFEGDSTADRFGASVSTAGDVNGDGFDDLVVGAHLDDNNGNASGSARVFSGFDGSVLYTFDGDSTGDRFGGSVSTAGDVNGDGFSDLIVGAGQDDNNGADSGSARVFSGFDGSVLYTFDGDSQGDRLGGSVSTAGDVNGDGFGDVIVGIRLDDDNGADSGRARIFSGLDGSVLYTFDGDSAGDELGGSVSTAGDVNGDGLADVIVGARFDDNNGSDSGSARVFSGADGSVLHTFDGDAPGDEFGASVSGAGNVRADGLDDLVVGAPKGAGGAGYTRVLSGADGTVLYTLDGNEPGDELGGSVSGAGDVDGDGLDEVIVGAAFTDNDEGTAVVLARSDPALYTFYGDTPYDYFADRVSGAGDVNADGFDDLIVGTPWPTTINGFGYVRVLSGADGSVLYTFYGDSMSDRFGGSIDGAGDVNGDGFDDLIVGAHWDDNNGPQSGNARVFSGFDGSILYDFDGNQGDVLGSSVSGAGDLNGDGFDDVIVGVIWDSTNGPGAGGVRVFSGFDGSLIHVLFGDSRDDRMGASVDNAGDVNGDGVNDVIAGAPTVSNNGDWSGSARVYSGFDGSVLYTFYGDSPEDRFGASVSTAGDMNGDGFDDLIVGAPQDSVNGIVPGYARVFSGFDGSVLYTFGGDFARDRFGISVSAAGDQNGDGLGDVIVGGPRWLPWTGYARVFSGADGSVLRTLHGETAGDLFGDSVSGAGDVTGDGFDGAVIVGMPRNETNGTFVGAARVFDPCILADVYCSPAVQNSTGQPARLRGCGSATAVDNSLTIQAMQFPSNQWGYFLNSQTQGFSFPVSNSQGALCLGGTIGRYTANVFNTGTTGSASLSLDLTQTPTPTGTISIHAGETWNFQCWYRDSNPGPTSNFTDAISVTFE